MEYFFRHPDIQRSTSDRRIFSYICVLRGEIHLKKY